MANVVDSSPSIGSPMVMVESIDPSPNHFDIFLPWACKQMQILKAIVVNKVAQQEFERPRSVKSGKEKRAKGNVYSDHSALLSTKRKSKSEQSLLIEDVDNIIVIEAFYQGDDLVHIKFGKSNPLIPREVIKLIALIAKFYRRLTKLSVQGGLSAALIYDISSLVPMSRITELIFDDCFLEESNFHIVLDKSVNLMHFSLARCQITDEVLLTIAEKLMYPKPASKTLSILNLSSNFITDVGANYLAQALRTNRHLKYLNIANNSITDIGAEYIFSSLYEFPLTYHEYMEVSYRYIEYARVKNAHIVKILADMKKSGEYERYVNRLNSRKTSEKGKKGQKATPSKIERLGVADIEKYFYDKAKETARGICGDFTDPFSRNDAFSKNELLYSKGNNTLTYLNLSFNQLTLLSLRTILKVLTYQKSLKRMPWGLLNLRIDGNCMPDSCTELYEINNLLESHLMLVVKSPSKTMKRNMAQKNK